MTKENDLPRSEEVLARVIEAISSCGGGEEVSQIDRKYEALNQNWFRPVDHEHIPSETDTRWHKEMRWALTRLKKEKILNNPHRGYWELSGDWKNKADPAEEFRQLNRQLKKMEAAKKTLSKLSDSELRALISDMKTEKK